MFKFPSKNGTDPMQYSMKTKSQCTVCPLGRVNIFSSRVSRVGGKTNQIDPLRLGPGSFASKLLESSGLKIVSKLVL